MVSRMSSFSFSIEKKTGALARAGIIRTPHGDIETPAFIAVGTKATVKSLTPELIRTTGAQAVLANTYHLYLEPGEDVVAEGGGLARFMGWEGPTFTDSGGFQVFSLGAGYGKGGANKFKAKIGRGKEDMHEKLAVVDEEGVTFRSHIDGSEHRFTPERSMDIQHALGADIIFAFDECASPDAPHDYQRVAMERTHRWAERSLAQHRSNRSPQALFGIVQGGRHEDLRSESARIIGGMDFDGFGIGGSFSKEDLGKPLEVVNRILPEEKPRHLLGIGEPEDMLIAIGSGIDTFDCVAPTRIARTGCIYTNAGKVNLLNASYTRDFSRPDEACACYTCARFTKAYLAHLFRTDEMLGATLASVHNLSFIISVAAGARAAILEGRFDAYREAFLRKYRV